MQNITNLSSVIYIDNLPKIDLHGETRETARVLINDFINDNIKQSNNIILIIHGKGNGILRKETHETLKLNKNVVDYKTYYYNEGSTIVQIKGR